MAKIFLKAVFIFAFSVFAFTAVSVSASVVSGDEDSRFPFFLDIKPDHKDFEAVTYLHVHEMVNGYDDNTFRADNKISRVESVKLLLEASKKLIQKAPDSGFIFSDISTGEWFSNYVYTAKRIGVINSDGEAGSGSFYPTRTVNRAEAIKMILEVNNINVRSAQLNEQWFVPYFEKANSLDIFTKKYTNENFDELLSYAGGDLTRGEISTYMYRYILYTLGEKREAQKSNNSNNLSADLFAETSYAPISVNALFSKGLLELKWNASPSDRFTIIVNRSDAPAFHFNSSNPFENKAFTEIGAYEVSANKSADKLLLLLVF